MISRGRPKSKMSSETGRRGEESSNHRSHPHTHPYGKGTGLEGSRKRREDLHKGKREEGRERDGGRRRAGKGRASARSSPPQPPPPAHRSTPRSGPPQVCRRCHTYRCHESGVGDKWTLVQWGSRAQAQAPAPRNNPQGPDVQGGLGAGLNLRAPSEISSLCFSTPRAPRGL